MTKKDFIRLLIKLLGVLILFSSLPSFFSQFALFFLDNTWEMILWIMVAFAVTIGFASWLIFYPDTIINFLKLDKGFDDNEVKLDQPNAENLISIAILIIGGLFIQHSFAPFLVNIGYKIQESISSNAYFSYFEAADNSSIYVNLIELGAGFFIITNFRRITRFVISKNEDKKRSI